MTESQNHPKDGEFCQSPQQGPEFESSSNITQNYNIRQVSDQYLKRCVLSLMQQINNYNKVLK